MPDEHGEVTTSETKQGGVAQGVAGGGGGGGRGARGRAYLPENGKLLRRHARNLVYTDDLLSVVYGALDGLQAAPHGLGGSVC